MHCCSPITSPAIKRCSVFNPITGGFSGGRNWWGAIHPPPPWDLEYRKADFDGVNAIRFLSSWTTRSVFENKKTQIWGSCGQKLQTIAVFYQMFRNVITWLFLERFRPNFRNSFSINKSITHILIFTVSENHRRFQVVEHGVKTCPRESGPGGASAQSRNSKIWCNIPNECLGKVTKFQVPILTLAGTGHFASFHGTTRGGGYHPPCRFAPDWARASRKKRACSSPRDEEIDA